MVNFKRSMTIAKKNLQIILNDRRSVGLLIFMPVLMMLLFGYGFGQQVENVPIKIVNLDKGGSGMVYPNGTIIFTDTAYSDQVIDLLDEDNRVDIELIEEDPKDFDLEKEKKKIYGAKGYFALLVIPANFSEDMVDLNKNINISVYLDGTLILYEYDPEGIVDYLGYITVTIDTTKYEDGNHSLTIIVKDYFNITASETYILTFRNTLQPTNNTTENPINLLYFILCLISLAVVSKYLHKGMKDTQ
ncbi:MAG: ABC transporter permease [Candidatus Heimdallarchaeota archaeon]|nr:ABC transporter permease [Candidatus Heimdallarchaeota archaeon]